MGNFIRERDSAPPNALNPQFMKTVKGILSMSLLIILLVMSGCLDDLLVWDFNVPLPAYSAPAYPAPPYSPHSIFNVDSVVYARDTATVYAILAIPDLADSIIYVHDMSFNYWEERISMPQVLNHTKIINDSIRLDREGRYYLTSTLAGLMPNTTYAICAESARCFAFFQELDIGGSCTSFSTIE